MYGFAPPPPLPPSPGYRAGKPAAIEVTGDGIVSVIPDQAAIVLGAVTEGESLSPLQAENARIISAVIDSLLQLGISRDNIQTDEFRIDPQYDFQDGKQIFRGYRVTHLLKITTERVGESGTIVDTAVSKGANSVSGISFRTSQPQKYSKEALDLAVRNAREKAQTIAASLGVTLAAVPESVREISRQNEPVPFKASVLAASPATPIQPGELQVYAAVSARYTFS
ncbi:SIMPL domain-containing protein [Paenibacillus chitinolyticus]|uniref:SIMPL domain-containing protein n=1 Tax=Paenibacillus chitinolyticus TaxID=79263 RepID=UPI001C46085C|nr:SIMPL domain-containing protein [Paenibacillus chitinolyticus]MBV6714179.1 SIMPL domain-containing protein [Paenibacillus chitinolyticus]